MKKRAYTKKQLDKACWALCPYLTHIDRLQFDMARSGLKDCKCEKCPEWEIMEGDKVTRGCRGMAQEAVEPVLKVLFK